MTDRRDLLRLAGFLVALLVVTGAILLATGGGSDSGGGGRAAGALQIDGTVIEVDAVHLVLKPTTGAEPMSFAIRATEQPQFDVFHLQQHSADGLPTRVTYIEQDGRRYALRADDAPG